MWQKLKNFSRKDPLLFVLAIIVIIVGATFGGLEAMHMTGSSKFCSTCHVKTDSGVRGEYNTWERNIHSKVEVSCLDCHANPGVVGYLDAHVIAGTKSLLYEIFVPEKRIVELLTAASIDPVKAEHAAPDAACLFCHSDEVNKQLRRDTLISIGVTFRDIDNVKNPQYRTEYGLADISSQPVSKGVEPNHAKHIAAGLLCTNCHLGVAHGGELYNQPKMETCFECHDSIRASVKSVPAEEDCTTCHVMQKEIQEGTYVQNIEEVRWYMADLDCSSCHETAFSLPTPETCVICHDDSYAEMMVDTQNDFKTRLKEASESYEKLFAERDTMPAGKRALFNEYSRLLRIAEMDGSKGVHNPEYFDELFNEAIKLTEDISTWTPPVEEPEEVPAVAQAAFAEVVTETVSFQGNSEELMDIASAMEIINIADKYVPAPTKPAVNFEHFEHAKKLACTECHEEPESGTLKFDPGVVKGMKNAFHDKLCIDCHTKMRVKKTCNTCHK